MKRPIALLPLDRLRRLASVVAVAVYALLSTFGAGLVVCAGEDGHVSVEWRGASCCVADHAAETRARDDAAASAVPAVRHSSCASCVDTPATDVIASRAGGTLRAPAPTLPSEVAACGLLAEIRPRWTVPSRPGFDGPLDAAIPPPRLAHLRTTVLRC